MKTQSQLFPQSSRHIGHFNGIFTQNRKWIITVLTFFVVCLLQLFAIPCAVQAASKTFETDTSLTQSTATIDTKLIACDKHYNRPYPFRMIPVLPSLLQK